MPINQPEENTMMRLCPMTWAALHVALAGAATVLLCSTDLLNEAAVVFSR